MYDDAHCFTFSLYSESSKKRKWTLCYVLRTKYSNAYEQNLRSKEMRTKWADEIQKVVGKEQIEVIRRPDMQRAQSDIVSAVGSSASSSKKPRAMRAVSVIHPNMKRPRLSLKVMMPRLKKSDSVTVSDEESNAKIDE